MIQPLLELLALSVELKRSKGDWSSKSRLAVAAEISRLVGDANKIINNLEEEEDEAKAPQLLEALEHSTTALSYIAAELEELGEHEDAAMMERQVEENRAAIKAAREG